MCVNQDITFLPHIIVYVNWVLEMILIMWLRKFVYVFDMTISTSWVCYLYGYLWKIKDMNEWMNTT
jgi:hypothetical protein